MKFSFDPLKSLVFLKASDVEGGEFVHGVVVDEGDVPGTEGAKPMSGESLDIIWLTPVNLTGPDDFDPELS